MWDQIRTTHGKVHNVATEATTDETVSLSEAVWSFSKLSEFVSLVRSLMLNLCCRASAHSSTAIFAFSFVCTKVCVVVTRVTQRRALQ